MTKNSDTTSLLAPNQNHKALICGLPHSVTNLIIDLCYQMLAQEHGQCNVIHINSLSAETANVLRVVEGPILFWADSPDRDVVDFASRAEFPVIVLHASFTEVVHEFMETRKAALIDSLRVLALARMGLWQIAELPRALTLLADHGELGRTVQKIAELTATLQMTPEINSWAETLRANATGSAIAIRPEHSETALDRIALDAIACFEAFYGKRSVEDARLFTIPVAVLYDGKPPHALLSGPIDLCGPARALTFGPFVYLPAGRWKLLFHFESRQNLTGNSFMFDIFTDMMVKNRADFQLRQDGDFNYECEFEIKDPWETFEFRTHLNKGSINGRFNPVSLQLVRI